MTRLCLLAAAAISLAQAPPAAAQSAPADTLPLALRRRTFEFVWRRVNDTFWDPARLEQRGWTAAHDRYLPRALAAPGTAEFHRVLNEMLSEIGTSHFAVLSPGRVAAVRAEAGTAPGGIGVRLRVVEHTATIVRVDSGSPAARAGLRPGVVVDSIDGRATAESIRQAGRDTASAPVEAPPALAAALNGPAGSEVRLSVHDPGGPLRTLRVTRGPRPGRYHRTRFLLIPAPGLPPRYGEVEARRLEGGIGYVRFSGFIQGLLPEVRRAVASMRDAPGMVLDLRGNPGGENDMELQVASLFATAPAPFLVSRRRGGERVRSVRPAAGGYVGPLVILVDRGSGSASEELAAGLQELGRARVVGERTPGRDLDAEFVKLPTGGLLEYAFGEVRTPRGVVLEGRGVVPDREVVLTVANLASGDDPQLRAALDLLREPR